MRSKKKITTEELLSVKADRVLPRGDATTKVSFPSELNLPNGKGKECLVILYGSQSLGKKYDLLEGVTTIGRDPVATITLDVDSVSRSHAKISIADGVASVKDLDSLNGTYVNERMITESPLQSGDLLKVGDVIFKFLAGQHVETAYHEEIYRMTIHDGLTGISNKRFLIEFLDREVARARRHGRELALLMFDIDHFKKINDLRGHLAGDYVLRELSQLVSRRMRRDELFARYGGEEFCVILPETSIEGAMEYAEILRKSIEEHHFEFDGAKIAVTVSLGVATYSPEITRPSDLLRRADEALYRSKNSGRNCVSS